MRSDLLSKRLFYVGCFGLPWLWTVHVLYHWKNKNASCTNNDDGTENDEALLNPDDHFADENDTTELTPEQIQIEVRKWVSRCTKGAMIGWILFVAWIILAQLLRGSVFPPSLYMLNADDVTVTGW